MSEVGAGTAVAKVENVTAIKEYIEKNIGAVSNVLPRVGLTPEALFRTAMSQIYRNPLLQECDKMSVMRAIVEAAALGLSFSLGRAYLVPFNNTVKDKRTGREFKRMEATLIPGYQGLADVARRSGEIASINAQAVYEGDEFSWEFGLKEDKLSHRPLGDPDPNKVTHAYAVVRFKDGGYQVRVLTRKQIERTRQMSKSPNSPMWVKSFDEAAIKTVVKKVLKLCPASPELVRAIALDNRVETGEAPEVGSVIFQDDDEQVIDVATSEVAVTPVPPPQSKSASVAEALKGTKKGAAAVVPATPEPAAPSEPAAAPPAEEADPVRDAAWSDLCSFLDTHYKRTAEADMAISEATGGKFQSRAALKDASAEVLARVLVALQGAAAEAGGPPVPVAEDDDLPGRIVDAKKKIRATNTLPALKVLRKNAKGLFDALESSPKLRDDLALAFEARTEELTLAEEERL